MCSVDNILGVSRFQLMKNNQLNSFLFFHLMGKSVCVFCWLECVCMCLSVCVCVSMMFLSLSQCVWFIMLYEYISEVYFLC